jgi:serralysin
VSARSAASTQFFDWTNQQYSTNAWAAYVHGVGMTNLVTSSGRAIQGPAYVANGVGTTNLITSSSDAISGAASGSTTLYGGGFNVGMHGRASETVFVGGAGGQIMVGGAGANIFKYLAISDSPANGAVDVVMNFDPDKDVIDRSTPT